MKFNTWLNYEQKDFEKCSGESMTVPDQTMTMREILHRYARGLPLGGGSDVYYDEEDNMPDIRTMDLVDIAELRDAYMEKQLDYEMKMEKAKSEKQRDKYRKEWEAEQKVIADKLKNAKNETEADSDGRQGPPEK